jgi:hypothetical protein
MSFQPPFSGPTSASAGSFTSSKNTTFARWPLRPLMGWIVMPGVSSGTRKTLMPPCRWLAGSVRAASHTYCENPAVDVNIF